MGESPEPPNLGGLWRRSYHVLPSNKHQPFLQPNKRQPFLPFNKHQPTTLFFNDPIAIQFLFGVTFQGSGSWTLSALRTSTPPTIQPRRAVFDCREDLATGGSSSTGASQLSTDLAQRLPFAQEQVGYLWLSFGSAIYGPYLLLLCRV